MNFRAIFLQKPRGCDSTRNQNGGSRKSSSRKSASKNRPRGFDVFSHENLPRRCVILRKSSEGVCYLAEIVRGGVLSCENRPRGCVILRKSSEGVCYLTTIVGRGVVCYHTKIVGGGVVCCLACCTRYSTSYAAVLVVSLVSGPVPLSLFGEVTYVCIHRPCVCR